MKTRILTIVLLAVCALAWGVTPATANEGAPQDVEIYAETDLTTGVGWFTATGPAVDNGVICPSGTTVDLYVLATAYQSGFRLNLLVYKEMTCDDGSGTFLVKLEVRPDERNFTRWNVLSGTGDYEYLAGTGSLTAVGFDGGVIDYYTGKLH